MSEKSYTQILHSLDIGDFVTITDGPFKDFEGEVVGIDETNEAVIVWFEYVDKHHYTDFRVEFIKDALHYIHSPMKDIRPTLKGVLDHLSSAAMLMEETGSVESSLLDEIADEIMQTAMKLQTFVK